MLDFKQKAIVSYLLKKACERSRNTAEQYFPASKAKIIL